MNTQDTTQAPQRRQRDRGHDKRRKAFAAGLRELADQIEADRELPLPYDGTTTGMSWIETYPGLDLQRRRAASYAAAVTDPTAYRRGDVIDVLGTVGGVNTQMILSAKVDLAGLGIADGPACPADCGNSVRPGTSFDTCSRECEQQMARAKTARDGVAQVRAALGVDK